MTITASLRAGTNPAKVIRATSISAPVSWSPSSLVFTLDPTDPNTSGLATGSLGINIGYLPDSGQWKITQGTKHYNYTYLQVTSTAPITGLTFIGASRPTSGPRRSC